MVVVVVMMLMTIVSVFQLLSDIEEHLDITIDRIDKTFDVPVNEFDGKVTYGQKRKTGGRLTFSQTGSPRAHCHEVGMLWSMFLT